MSISCTIIISVLWGKYVIWLNVKNWQQLTVLYHTAFDMWIPFFNVIFNKYVKFQIIADFEKNFRSIFMFHFCSFICY